jgi:hypothetical protein
MLTQQRQTPLAATPPMMVRATRAAWLLQCFNLSHIENFKVSGQFWVVENSVSSGG